jgi:hypothetical protein
LHNYLRAYNTKQILDGIRVMMWMQSLSECLVPESDCRLKDGTAWRREGSAEICGYDVEEFRVMGCNCLDTVKNLDVHVVQLLRGQKKQFAAQEMYLHLPLSPRLCDF